VIHHAHQPPRSPVSETGRAPRDYGAGRVCSGEGCATILRRTNPRSLCTLCEAKAARVRDERRTARAAAKNQTSGPPASAAGTAGTKAAPVVRIHEEETLRHVKTGVLERLRATPGKRWNTQVLADLHSCSRKRVQQVVRELKAEGEPVTIVLKEQGGGVYHGEAERSSNEGEESAKPVAGSDNSAVTNQVIKNESPANMAEIADNSADNQMDEPVSPSDWLGNLTPATSPAPAPEPNREQPADAADPAGSVGPPPFAGIEMGPDVTVRVRLDDAIGKAEALTTDWFRPLIEPAPYSERMQVGAFTADPEIVVLINLEAMSDERRDALLRYAVGRWPTEKETCDA